MTQPTNKKKQNLKKYVVFAIMIAAFCGCLWLIFAPSKKDKEAQQEGTGFNAEIPDPRGAVIVDDKKTAYEQEQQRQRQEEKMRTLADYSSMLSAGDETPEERAAREERQLRMAPVPPDYQEELNRQQYGDPTGYSWQSRRGNAIEASGSAHAGLNDVLGSFYDEPAEDAEKEAMQKELDELKELVAQQSRSAAVEDPMAMLEKSFELAAKFNNPQPDPNQAVQVEPSGRRAKVQTVSQVHPQVVSSLNREMSDAEFIQAYSQPRNFGFNTVSDAGDIREKNTIAAVVHGDHTLIDGQAVRLRTTEAMRAGRHDIPRNTIITGGCRISGERLEISVTSIEYDGNIIPVELAVYDSDGQEGIYIPGSMEIEAFKEITGNMGQNLGTTINLNQQSAGEQLLTDLGRGAIQGTSQYIAKKARQVKVTLKAGYRLLLLPDENV